MKLSLKEKVFAGVLLLSVIAGLYVDIEEEKQWQAYAKENDCKVVKFERGGVDYLTNGESIIRDDKTTYRCDDGMEYVR